MPATSVDNESRALAADVALVAYTGDDEVRQGEEKRSTLTDLLTDLRHWARLNGVDFDTANNSAEIHFNVEVEEPEPEECEFCGTSEGPLEKVKVADDDGIRSTVVCRGCLEA